VSLETASLITLGWLVMSLSLAFFEAWKTWCWLKILSIVCLVLGMPSVFDPPESYSLLALTILGVYAIPIGLVIGAIFWMSYRFGEWRANKKAAK
jgi:uncharacterized membrane protein HdeD (DUF308 family)